MSSNWAAHSDSESDNEVEVLVKPTTPTPEVAPAPVYTKPAAPRRERPKTQYKDHLGFVMGIKYSANRNELEDFLWENGVQTTFIDFVKQPDGKFAGKAKVEFASEESYENFLNLNGASFQGKEILTKEWESRSSGGRPEGGRGGRGGDRDRDDRRGGYPGGRGGDRDRDSNYRGHERREPRPDTREFPGRRSHNAEEATGADKATEAPKERPRLVLAPRTKPVEEIGKPAVRAADIFGGGKAHDEFEYEQERKKAAAVEPAAPVAPAAESAAGTKGAYDVTPPAPAAEGDFAEVKKGSRKPAAGPAGGRGKEGGRGAGARPASSSSNKQERKTRKEAGNAEESSSSAADQNSKDATVLSSELAEVSLNTPSAEDNGFVVVERKDKRSKKESAPSGPPATAGAPGHHSKGFNKERKDPRKDKEPHSNSNNHNSSKGTVPRAATKNPNSVKPLSAAPTAKDTTSTTSSQPNTSSNVKPTNAYAGLQDSDQDD